MITKKHHRLLEHLEKLPAFACAARTTSFRQAANQLGVTQPALSRSIRTLEDALGIKLFVRQINGSHLTHGGVSLLEHVDKMLVDLADAEIRIRNHPEPMAGKICIGTFESIAIYFWPAFLSRLSKKYPALLFDLSTVNESEHLSMLKKGRLHLVVNVEPPTKPGIFSTIIFDDRFYFFAAPGVSSSKAPLIYVPNAVDRYGVSLKRHIESQHAEFQTFYALDTFESAKALAVARLGVAALPGRVAQSAMEAGHLERITVDGFPSHGFGSHRICASLLEENRSTPRLKTIIRELKLDSGIKVE